MKKMAVVPYKMLEEMQRWKTEQRPKLPPSPQVVQTVDLQKEMGSVLQRDDLSESEKAQRFGETLQKFQLAHKKAIEQPTTTTVSKPPPPPSTEKPTSMQERILDSVPATMRRKAKLLLHMLEGHPDMTWDAHGTLEYQGKPVVGSNVIDLVNDVLRHRKSSKPKGWEQFAQGLKDINVPQEVVGNKQRWAWMQKEMGRPMFDEEEEDVFFIPPSLVNTCQTLHPLPRIK